ncbi:MAG: septation protein A [Uliginosibacterium sp.]|jgi:intracellular septation protein|nr:septation protein A [Uliginosibacterium sp.]
MKLALDFFPILLFFVAYKFASIYVATAVAIGAAVLQLLYARLVLKRIDAMLWFSCGVVVVFGGLTLALHNPTFIKWKPTIIYWSMGLALAFSAAFLKRNLISKLMGQQISLPDEVWGRLNLAWIAFLLAVGTLNLFVAYSFSESTWVNFKLFGIMGLMLVFIVAQAAFLSRYMKDEGKPE